MRKRNKVPMLLSALFGAALLFGAGTTAHAYSTTLDGATCASCFGNTYTLTVNEVSSNPGITTYNVIYTIDTSPTSSQLNNYINAVAFKVATFANIDTLPTVSGVSGFTTVSFDGLNAAPGGTGCGGGGTSGFMCSGYNGTTGALVDGSNYTWTFSNLKLKTGTLFTDQTQWSIKALYVDGTGKQTGITSEAGVPEPATSLLLGAGLVLLGGAHRFRSKAGQQA